MKIRTFLCGLGLTALSVATGAARAQTQPPIPFVDRGACPFECCTYRRWTVEKPTVVRSRMSNSSPIAFRLRAGERGVRGITGVVITTQPGIAEAVKASEEGTVRLSRGDRIFLLTNLGEGIMKAWFKGRIFDAEPYDPGLFRILRHPTAVWWVKVRNSRGKIGWSRQPENFGNVDQCG